MQIQDQFPCYWLDEISGVLRPAIEAYLNHEPMSVEQIGAMRAYLRQWVNAPVWRGKTIKRLRATINDVDSREKIVMWLRVAEAIGVDPL